MSDLPPGCHIIPQVEVPVEEQRDILRRMLRRAQGECRLDIIEVLRRLRMMVECDKWAVVYRAWAAAYYTDKSIDQRRYVRGLCAR